MQYPVPFLQTKDSIFHMSDLFDKLKLTRGPEWSNRFLMAPLTNTQSHKDGTLSDDEYIWLTKRSEGGFGAIMTCASHVSANGKGFPGQLGIWKDDHIEGLSRLADTLNKNGVYSIAQLHHAGMRSPHDAIEGAPECPSDNPKYGAKGLTLRDVERVQDDFVDAAKRAEKAGFYGIELHGAHGYLLCQFLSPVINQREDDYGSSPENRARIIINIIKRIRAECGRDFSIGIRLSPERFGLDMAEIKGLAQQLLADNDVDYLDMSLWNVFNEPRDEAHKGKSLIKHFSDLERNNVRLGVTGNIRTGRDARRTLEDGADFAVIGRCSILHHDFPNRVAKNREFEPVSLPVSREYLKNEALSDTFVDYLVSTWPEQFVEG